MHFGSSVLPLCGVKSEREEARKEHVGEDDANHDHENGHWFAHPRAPQASSPVHFLEVFFIIRKHDSNLLGTSAAHVISSSFSVGSKKPLSALSTPKTPQWGLESTGF